MKKQIEEFGKVVEKVKNDNYHLQSKVQNIIEYLGSLEDKIDEQS